MTEEGGGVTNEESVVSAKSLSKPVDVEAPQMVSGEVVSPDARELQLKLPWTKSKVVEFQVVWATMKKNSNEDMALMGVDILLWILKHVPGAKELFVNFSTNIDPNDRKSVHEDKFMKHGIKIVYELDRLINALNDPAQTLHILKANAYRHADHLVELHHFETFRDQFHLFLLSSCNYKKDSRETEMWNQFLTAFIEIYKDELAAMGNPLTHREPEEEVKKKGCCSLM